LRAWASGCALTGDCIAACPEGINPRFLLAMTRVTLARQSSDLRERRKKGIIMIENNSSNALFSPNLARRFCEKKAQP